MAQARFLVTGGAGFLGINLCRYLLGRGHSVRSMDIAPFEYPERVAIEAMRADIRDAPADAAAMRDIDIVVHCAAALPRSRRKDIESTDVEGTRLLLAAASAAQRVQRFIFISSTSVYGIPDHHPIVEEDSLRGVGPYGEAKIAAERHCDAFRATERLCIPVLRPKSFVGPERLGAFELLYEWAYSGRNFPMLGDGANRFQLLDVEDLCEAIYRCAMLPRDQVNDVFNVGANVFGSMRDNIQCVLDRAGHGKHAIGLPIGPAVAALRLLEAVHLSPLYRWIYESASEDSYVSIARLQRRLGLTPQYSNRDALIRNYDWYTAHRGQYLGKTGVTHRVPWKKGALSVAKWFF